MENICKCLTSLELNIEDIKKWQLKIFSKPFEKSLTDKKFGLGLLTDKKINGFGLTIEYSE
jgi:hypothetical protein